MKVTDYPSWPSFSEEEADAVKRVLLSNKVNYWTGEEGRQFEQEFAKWAGTDHAIALSNGTVALELAFRSVGIGPGDEVIVTPRTFIASASCIANLGATPIFADVDSDSQNICADSVKPVLGPRTKAIVCVHLAGWPCDMDPIMDLARKHGLFVIEDCAQAHGARYKGNPVGSIGHIGAWSFCHDKIMSTGGEGGMVTTNDRELWSRMWSYKEHGKSWDAVFNRKHPIGFRWLHESLGTNGRITEMQSAIGRIQLGRMPEWHRSRQNNARWLTECFRKVPGLRVPVPPEDIEHAYYRYYVFVRPQLLKRSWSRDRIIQAVLEKGVPCFSGSCPEVYLEKAFRDHGRMPSSRLPVARQLGDTSLAFLVHPNLGRQEMQQTCEAVTEIMRQAVN